MTIESRLERQEIHILGLQAALTKRNAEIARLREELSAGPESPTVRKALADAYKRGWRECASQLMETTREAAQKLGEVRNDAWSIYLQAERDETDD